MKIKNLILILTLIIGINHISYGLGGIVDLRAGIFEPKMNVEGTIITDEGKKYDIQDTFDLEAFKRQNWFIDIGLPLLPNIRLEHQPIYHEGENQVEVPVDIGWFDIKIKAYDKVKTKVDLQKNYDLIAYYDFKFPYLTPKIGVAVKYVKGDLYAEAKKLKQKDHAKVKAFLPLIFLGAEASVPLIPLVAKLAGEFEIKGISYDNSYYLGTKWLLKIKLLLLQGVGSIYAGTGYQTWDLVLKNLPSGKSNPQVDLHWRGTFMEFGLEF